MAAVSGMLLLAACEAGVPSTPPASASAAAPTASVAAERAVDLLECDGRPSDLGGRAGDFGPSAGGATPDEAFAAFVNEGPFVIPRSGYERLGAAGDRTVWIYEVEGRTKVVIVISPRYAQQVGARFAIDELRSCDSSEYGAAVDLGPQQRAWAHVETGEIITDVVGPAHCGWESARILHLGDGTSLEQYVRDPEAVFAGLPLLETYAEDVELPADASDSGYRSPEGYELWFTAARDAAYVVTPEGIERWPRPRDGVGCS